jgi:uncharacterized SAM-binding protein YcdF (DUF218 family)
MDAFEPVFRFFGWWIINIDQFFLALLFVGAGLLWFKRKKWGSRLVLLSCIGFAFFGVIPIGLWTLENLENRFPKLEIIPEDAKGIIFLGGSFDTLTTGRRGETAYSLAGGRFVHFVELAKKYPHLQLVCTGTPLEAETAKRELKALGIDPSSVLFEADSKDTRGNALKTADLLHPKHQDKWVLVTSAFHMARSAGLFRKVGFHVIPYPVDYHTPGKYELWFFLGLKLNLEAWHVAAREELGMLANYIMGRSDELFPGVQ